MEKYSEVIGLPVICVETGEKIGEVKDVIFSVKQKEATAILLERKGCKIGKKVILFKDVVSLGHDAVIVSDCNCINKLNKVKKDIKYDKNEKIKGLRIYSKNGTDMGMVSDIFFDYKNGNIEALEVSDGLLQDIYKGRKILPLFGKVEFAEECILIDRDAVEEITATGGGIKNKLLK